ncbi:NAC domain-containing protein [Hirschfeldia incana]|nr:NAC domain-containing protein [Hirschfeldia incana]
MERDKPGFGFRPYDEELVGYYLPHKILGNDGLVDGVINEIDVYSVDPWNLHFQWRDPVLYFFSRRENKYANGNHQSRTTPSGFWKLTGKPVDVNDRWGNVSGSRGQMLGQKRVLTFVKGKNNSSSISEKTKTKSDWVMHELHSTIFPEDKRTYVVCRLEYKGDDVSILSANATHLTPAFVPNSATSSVVDQSFQVNSEHNNTFPEHLFSGIFDMPFREYSDNFSTLWDYALPNQSNWFSGHVNVQVPPNSALFEGNWDTQMLEQHSDSFQRTLTRDDRSRYRPKKPVTGILPGDSLSDSDTDSMIGTDAWSSTDSVGSKDGPCHTPIDDTPSLSTIEPLHNHEAQEQPKQLELQLQGKEKVMGEQKIECERKMAKDSIKEAPSISAVKQSWIVLEEMSQRNSRWVNFINMLIGLLLFITIILSGSFWLVR